MSAAPRRFRFSADGFRRWIAAGCSALVLALTVFAASPSLHNWLHNHDGIAGDDACPVVLFASGVSLPLGAIIVTPPAAEWRETPHASTAEVFLVTPRYLRQPERGPPVS